MKTTQKFKEERDRGRGKDTEGGEKTQRGNTQRKETEGMTEREKEKVHGKRE